MIRFSLPPKFTVMPVILTLGVVTFMLAAHNRTFWARLPQPLEGSVIHMAGMVLLAAATIWFFLTLLGPRWLQKPMLMTILVLGGVTSYYQDTLGATIDRDMIQNAVATTVTESKHLITAPFLWHVLALGILPALLVAALPVRRARPLRAALNWGVTLVCAFGIFLGTIATDAKFYMSLLREHREIVAAIQPLAPLSGMLRYAKQALIVQSIEAAPLGTDAHAGAYLTATDDPVLLVLWVGETARAASWGMDGAPQDTTPELRARGVVNYSDVTACGTATAVSMPCMFSALTQAEYSQARGLAQENLLDVLIHAGFAVEWWDNNTGDKAIAARAVTGSMAHRAVADICGRGECTDAIFLDLIREKAASLTQDTVLVLHQIGSHGPSYALRYPADFKGFEPACLTPVVVDCTDQELANAYDNTLLFTDWIMAQSIDILAATPGIVPAMFYLSDHGESLGEHGLYLHGAPRFMAPDEQIKVPMVTWLSPAFETRLGVSMGCLRAGAQAPVSHDNMFSTVLGLLDVQTAARVPTLDLTAPCRRV